MFLLLVLACGPASTPAPAPAPAPVVAPEPTPDELGLKVANAAATELVTRLRARLQEEMKAKGPVAAATVCADEAQGLTALVGGEMGASVGRSSIKLRNPASAPPPWVGEWLVAQGVRSAEGVTGIEAVVDAGGHRVARVLRPIVVEEPCLKCHGAADALAPGVPELLAARYPNDNATGYAVGDLRGALWAEVEVK